MTLRADASASGETKPFVEHLEDLRRTLILSLSFLAVGMLAALPLAPWILRVLKGPVFKAGIPNPETFLRVLHVASGFQIWMRVVFWSGLVVSLPGIIVVVGRFVFPGLTRRERKAVVHGISFAGVLFAVGVATGYFMTLPVAIRMLLGINTWLGISCEFVELADYITFALQLLAVFGLVFELPVVILVLGRLGIVNSDQLRAKRRHAIVAITVVSAILTPPDAVTLVLMSVPLVLLYEACIWILRGLERPGGPQGA